MNAYSSQNKTIDFCIAPLDLYDKDWNIIVFFQRYITSCDLLSLQCQLTSVVGVQSRGYWQCQFLLFYTIDTAPIIVEKL